MLHAINKTSARRSPEREALAAAIDEKKRSDAQLEAQREAVSRAERLVGDAETKLAAAVAAVADAREQQGRRVAEAVSKGRATPASALRAARAAETEAQDDLDAARAALEHLQSELADLEVETTSVTVDAAINGVLSEAVPGLVAAIAARRTELLALLSIVYFIRRRPALSQLAGVVAQIDAELQLGPGAWGPDAAMANLALAPWREWVLELHDDADAEIARVYASPINPGDPAA